jgi:hypothetical protein
VDDVLTPTEVEPIELTPTEVEPAVITQNETEHVFTTPDVVGVVLITPPHASSAMHTIRIHVAGVIQTNTLDAAMLTTSIAPSLVDSVIPPAHSTRPKGSSNKGVEVSSFGGNTFKRNHSADPNSLPLLQVIIAHCSVQVFQRVICVHY